MLEGNGDLYHIYATLTEAPVQANYLYPSNEALSTVGKQIPHHYDFSDDYSPTENTLHYEMESTLSQRDQVLKYDQPIMKTQPYEVPVTALQFNQEVSLSFVTKLLALLGVLVTSQCT